MKKALLLIVFSAFILCHSAYSVQKKVPKARPKQPLYTSFIEGFVRYDNIWLSPIGNAVIKLMQNNVVVAQTISDPLGYFIFQGVAPGTYTLLTSSNIPIGGINSSDALLTLQYAMVMVQLSNLQKLVADVNGNGNINSVDALLIMKFFTGQILHFVIPDWFFEVPTVTVNGYNSASILYKGLVAGDVNRSYIP